MTTPIRNLDEQLLALLRTLVRDVLREELRATQPATEVVYSTAPGHWPPGCRSRRSARDRIRAAGGEQLGAGRAAVWSVTIDAYRTYHARRRTPATPAATGDLVDIDTWIAAAGARLTRKVSR